jgi:hypothetical protein
MHFGSVGTRFNVTRTNSAGDPRRYDEGVSLADLIRHMPAELDRAMRHRRRRDREWRDAHSRQPQFKDKYAPDFTRGAIREARAGRLNSASELEQLGLVAPPDVYAPLPEAPARFSGNRKWPSYAICLDGAPFNSEDSGPDPQPRGFRVLH